MMTLTLMTLILMTLTLLTHVPLDCCARSRVRRLQTNIDADRTRPR
jgi:hypothetical protein